MNNYQLTDLTINNFQTIERRYLLRELNDKLSSANEQKAQCKKETNS